MAFMALPDYYKILGLGQSASQEEIKLSFRKLAKTYHPDVSKVPDAGDRFLEINEAYAILGDPEKRKTYHLQLRRERENLHRPFAQPSPQTARTKPSSGREYDEWVRQARDRADQEARMSWKDYEKSRFDETELKMYFILQLFMFFFVGLLALFLMVFPVLLMFNFHWLLIFMCLGTVPLGMKLLSEAQKGLKTIRVERNS
jgi:curved DNA-binding protein CbpA